MASILAGQEQVALFLLENGANPHLLSEFDGLTPIQAARKVGMLEVEAKLVTLGVHAPPAESQNQGWLSRWLRNRAA